MDTPRIVLAYSGGLDTSAAIAWIAERYAAEVIAVTLDFGQGRELTGVRERALAVGAARAHVLDVRDEFAADYILPALQAGALYEDRYPLATALSRPLLARKLVEVARMEGSTIIAHGCNGQANDELRIELGVRALDPSMTVLAPARIWGMTREQLIDYARARRIPIPAHIDSPYTVDTNLWGRSIERGVLEDPWQESPEDVYTLTRAPRDCPDEPAYVEIEFEQGVPLRANGVEMPLVELIESLETIAGAHGVGRIDMVENAAAGGKSREIYEAPAAVLLHTAHSELEKLVVPRDLERLGHDLGRAYADLAYTGRWFSPTREAIDAFMRTVQPRVTGAVRLKLFKGDCRVVGRRSPLAIEADNPLSTVPPPHAARAAAASPPASEGSVH
ncbi:MAG TPA: argininosuccinate synthase [Vicinamibacterales bacterium]|jgi:argininosuccinate synthase